MHIAMELALKPTKASSLVELLAFLALLGGAFSKIPVINWICRCILGALVIGFFVFMAKQEPTQSANYQLLPNWRLFAALSAGVVGGGLVVLGFRRQDNGQKSGALSSVGTVLLLTAIALFIKW